MSSWTKTNEHEVYHHEQILVIKTNLLWMWIDECELLFEIMKTY